MESIHVPIGVNPAITPYLTVEDADAAIHFYQKAFGFERKLRVTDEAGHTQHAEMVWRDGLLMFGPAPEGTVREREGASAVMLQIAVEDVDLLYQRALAAGAIPVRPPRNEAWGDRTCILEDPDGYRWLFTAHRTHRFLCNAIEEFESAPVLKYRH
ncbi:MAG: VOC family protein [Deltaproteobacteria bacterium]|nr:MAG: VOC family protein [Deltaproteobacteria bacterium]